jgi:transcriptional regulator MraZ
MLVGEYDFTLDAKNRVAIPARLRSVFAQGITLSRGSDSCIAGYAPEAFHTFIDAVFDDASGMSRKGRAVRRFNTSGATELELDGQGRVTIPTKLLQFAGVSREVTIIGVRDHIEIWDRAAWTEYIRRQEEEADDIADELATS